MFIIEDSNKKGTRKITRVYKNFWQSPYGVMILIVCFLAFFLVGGFD